VRSFVRGAAVDREVFAVVFDPVDGSTHEGVVSVTAGEVRSWRLIPEIQPAITVDEFIECEEAVKANPAFQAALRKRGVTQDDMLVVEAWPVGDYTLPSERGRRLVWTPVWMRRGPSENAYARPVEGLIAIVDLSTMEIVRLEDHGVVPLPPSPGTYAADAVGPLRADLQPLEVVQPEGPSFGIDGWEVRWQKWRFRIGFTQREGLVLHTIGYEDAGRVRPIAYRASFAELFVPYGDPTPGSTGSAS
jgi:primary-amine oxidase